jgi:hypothetical protein
MRQRNAVVALLATLVAGLAWAQPGGKNSGPANGYKVPRTSWGDPDISGVWPGTSMMGVPLQRDPKLGTRNVLNDAEFAARAAQAEHQLEQDNEEIDVTTVDTINAGAVGSPTSPPPHWLERGAPQRQASLVVDPPNGRVPAWTDLASKRQAALREARAARGPADSYTDRSLYDRCITRGLDGSPHVGGSIQQWMGDSRGHWDGDTLVVETTNFTDQTAIAGTTHSAKLKTVERFTRVADDTLLYELTISDPETWVSPWTIQLPLQRDDNYGMFEYACHEGNRAMANILSGARATERAEAAKKKTP